MKYFIAIDSGGYKTQSVLFDQTGTVLAYDYGRGANAFDVGPEEATNRLIFSIDNLRDKLPAGEKIRGIFGSISLVIIPTKNSVSANASSGISPIFSAKTISHPGML